MQTSHNNPMFLVHIKALLSAGQDYFSREIVIRLISIIEGVDDPHSPTVVDSVRFTPCRNCKEATRSVLNEIYVDQCEVCEDPGYQLEIIDAEESRVPVWLQNRHETFMKLMATGQHGFDPAAPGSDHTVRFALCGQCHSIRDVINTKVNKCALCGDPEYDFSEYLKVWNWPRTI